jgi:C4-dicarboxylate-specific signal transduction histidine kinase
MSSAADGIEAQQLRYFGKVSASVSHELKNVLAILNEHAGLLQDYAAMAARGQPLDVERIRRLSDTMQAQIGRGDAIVKRMNRFAHSADQERARVDLAGLAALVAELFARTATTRGVRVEVSSPAGAVSLRTQPFALETLLGSLLDRLTGAASDVGTLAVELGAQAAGAQIRIAGLVQHAGALAGLLQADDLRALLVALHATAVFSQDGGELLITLPGDIDA